MSSLDRMGVPPRRPDIFFIRSPKADESFKFTIYSETIEGLYTHYNGRITVPCYLDRSLCDPKHSLLNLRWKGYVFGWDHQRSRLCFVQFTHDAANSLLDMLEGPQSIRGMTVNVRRTKAKNGRMGIAPEAFPGQIATQNLRAAPSVRKSLFNLFQLEPRSDAFTTMIEELANQPVEVLKFG